MKEQAPASPAPAARPNNVAPAPPRYIESVRVPTWLYFALSTPLGIVLGVMTGFAVTGSLDGGEAVGFYIVMGSLALLFLFLLVNFTNLTVSVTETSLYMAFGVIRKRLALQDISSAQPADYRWTEYGGWGIRWALRGKRAWSVPGVKRGVLTTVTENGKARSYFISSRLPDELALAVLPAPAGAKSQATPAE